MLQPTRRLRTAFFGAILTVGLTTATLTACSPSPETADPAATRPNGTGITVPTANSATTGTTSTSGGFDVLANMPTAAKQHSNSGAQAFARYYVEAYGRLLMDPAKGQLTRLESPQCTGCRKLERIIAENVDAGRRWTEIYFRTVNVGEPNANGEDVDASTVADIHLFSLLTNSPVVVHEAGGVATTRVKTSDVLAQFWLTWRDGQWLVTQFQDDDYTPTRS